MRRAIERAQRSPKALPGKTVVIGFSMGGGGALTYAAGMPDLVSAVVAYYPIDQECGGHAKLRRPIQGSDPCLGRRTRPLSQLLPDRIHEGHGGCGEGGWGTIRNCGLPERGSRLHPCKQPCL